ncbi:MAG: iron ABC transporter permease [Alphaproteobacteria bacterium]|nr:iron ABC transporter permease [Alphaproteobacteria bacterium]MCB9929710.1 iron ABC transporter permease [Alphaproteobacteria bacterium]
MTGTRGLGGGRAWACGVGLLAGLVALPLLVVVWLALTPSLDLWQHLWSSVLADYLSSTLLLGLGVGAGTLLLGVPLAWMVSVYEFPGRRWFDSLLFLPLAMPTYLIAFVYTDLLDYAGPVQAALRAVFGWQSARDYSVPEIRTLGGGIVVLSLCLYPYVYWLARAAFLGQGARQIEAARLLGQGPFGAFWRVGLPLARPALAAGVLIAWMETINDIGAVEHFGIQTLTVGIFDVWLHLGRPDGAAQIALLLLFLIVVLVTAEHVARGGRRFHTTGAAGPRRRLSPWRGWLTAALVSLPFALGFLAPAGRLFYYAIGRLEGESLAEFAALARNSLTVAAMTAAVAVVAALILAYGVRLRPTRIMRHGVRLATLGYGVPGAVLALGVLVPVTRLDLGLADLTEWLGGHPQAILGGTVFALVFALAVRFLALAHGTVDAGLQRVTVSMDDAARTLGLTPRETLWRVHVPILRGSLLTAAALVFVDTMKELPITLLLRPFNYETLASQVYQLASTEQLEACSLSALAIVVAGVVPVGILARLSGR